jgi:hypothetical protein
LDGKEEELILLEGLFLSDTVAYFIEKLQAQVPHLIESTAMIKEI